MSSPEFIVSAQEFAHATRGAYFRINDDFLNYLSLDEAAMVSIILTSCQLQEKKKKHPLEWILLRSSYVRRRIKLNDRAQNRILRSLKKKKILEYKMRGFPARRYIRFNFQSFYKKIYKLRGYSPDKSCRTSPDKSCRSSLNTKVLRYNTSTREYKKQEKRPLDNGFFQEEKSTRIKESTPLPIDEQNAVYLHDVIVRKHNYRRKWRVSQWTNEMKLLRQDIGNDAARLAAILCFYEKHKGPPTIINAKQFRRHFLWLESLSRKEGGSAATYKKPLIKITDLAKRIAKDVAKWGWPKGSADQLQEFVQVSFDNLAEFSAIRKDVKLLTKLHVDKGGKTYGSEYSFIQYMADVVIVPDLFIENWCQHVYWKVASWEKWSGKLHPFVFHLNAKHLDDLGKAWSQDWCERTHLWASYKELLHAGQEVRRKP